VQETTSVAESDSNFVDLAEHEVDLAGECSLILRCSYVLGYFADHLAESSSNVPAHDAVVVDDPEIFGDEEWDDSLDGEGEIDIAWDATAHEHEVASNESSVTLSSKTSSKRTYHDVEAEIDGTDEISPPSSHG
jgi:hypothetical protein